ncbi:EamA family transporter [Pseudonocardia sp. NPDC049635]|uniref:EamA family transporter n=1 Tax=Pseudonocardia sp. NPDC049635 TaxID=3155506 RepID=UPI003403DC36
MTVRDRGLAVVVAVLWGANFIAIHVGLEHFPPVFLAGLRMLVLAVPAVLLVPRPQVPLRWLVGYGLGFGTLQFLFLFLGMYAGMPAGLASLVLQASGPFTLVLGALLLREQVRRRQWIGIGVAVAGLATIALLRAQTAALLPVALTLLGALGWALGNLCNRLAQRDGAAVDPLHLTLWMCVVPPVPLLAMSAVVEGPTTGWVATAAVFSWDGLPGLAALLYLSVVATVVGSGIWTVLMRRYPAGVVAPHSLLVPVVGMGLAIVLLGERPSVPELLAGVVVVIGVLAASAPGRRVPDVMRPDVARSGSSRG